MNAVQRRDSSLVVDGKYAEYASDPFIPQDKASEELESRVVEVARLDAQLYTVIPAQLRQPMSQPVEAGELVLQ